MNDLIESLNIPKQILDKTEEFMKTILGPAANEFGELLGDKVRFRRFKNEIKIFGKARKLVEDNNLDINQLNLKTVVPLIEKSSLEEDEDLQDKWSNLLANMASSPQSGLEPKLVATLSSLSSIEAKILDFCYEKALKSRKERYERLKDSDWFEHNSVSEMALERHVIKMKTIESRFDIERPFSKIHIENIEALNLIKYDNPRIDIEDTFSEAKGKVKRINDEELVDIELDLDLDTDYWPTDNFKLTSFGIYFIEECKSVNIK